MNVLHNVTAIFRSPEAAALAASAAQASDLAARQGLASLQRDAVRREDQVQALEEPARSPASRERRQDPSSRRPGHTPLDLYA